MTVDMHGPIAETGRAGHIEDMHLPGGDFGEAGQAFKDFFPRLGAMRRLLGAAGAAIFSCPALGGAVGGQMSLVFHDENFGSCGIRPGSANGRLLLAHCERSVHPAAWSAGRPAGPKFAGRHETVARLDLPEAAAAGLALPVRLGGIGNGVIVFEDANVDLGLGNVFAVHRMAYRLMGDIFRVEIRRSTPKQTLSERELECLQWAGDGCKSEAIAEQLGLSVHTVNAYLGSATAKLDSVNRIQAIAKAIRLGLIA